MLKALATIGSHAAVIVIFNLTVFGGYHVYQWYISTQPQRIEVSELTDESLSELSKQIFQEQKFRSGK